MGQLICVRTPFEGSGSLSDIWRHQTHQRLQNEMTLGSEEFRAQAPSYRLNGLNP